MFVITGGAGFIGSNLVAGLLEAESVGVTVVDRLGADGIKWRNLAKHLVDDILPPEALDTALGRGPVTAVLHMGAISATTAVDGDEVVAANFHLSRRLWQWCAEREVPLIYASSAATYGDGTQGFEDDPTPEALARLRPLNLYGWSKHWFDRWAVDQVRRGAPRPPQWAGLKFFNVYGPNEGHKGDMMSVVAKSHPRCAAGEPVRLFKSHRPGVPDGEQKRDFVHVSDCVSVVQWLLRHPDVSGLFNVGTGEARSFRDLIAATFRACGRTPAIEYVEMPEPLRAKYQYFTQADMTRLRAVGYDRPFLGIEAGIEDYVTRYLSADDPHR